MEKETLYAQRLEDFVKILTFNQVRKIKYSFNSNIDLFYSIPSIWKQFRAKELPKKNVNPFSLIAIFNSFGLTNLQVKSIFGKEPNATNFTIPYSELIRQDIRIKVFKHGIYKAGDVKRSTCNKYVLDRSIIAPIFANPALLEKVCDAKSDYYTPRQRRLIFSQILKSPKKQKKSSEIRS